MSKHSSFSHAQPSNIPSKETLSVLEAAQILGFEQTTVYRLIWRGELRFCVGTARYRITKSEIERFLASTQTYDERVRSRRRTVKLKSGEKARPLGPLVHPSLNPHMLFVPLAAFGDRPVGGRLIRTVAPDDESLRPHAFIEVAEDEWIEETSHSSS